MAGVLGSAAGPAAEPVLPARESLPAGPKASASLPLPPMVRPVERAAPIWPSGISGWARRAAYSVIGQRRYDKLRFVKRTFLPKILPRYRERQAQLKRGEMGRLEDLYVFLTNQCNARCAHCFYIEELGIVPGELRLSDYQKLAKTLPPLRLLTLTGGEAVLHPECEAILMTLARATKAERVTIISNGFLPDKLEKLCEDVLREGIPGMLDVLISLDGIGETHNQIRRSPKAWEKANESLARLMKVRERHPGKFDVGVITIICDKNYTEIEALNNWVRERYVARHGFELVRGTDFSVWDIDPEVKASFNPPTIALPPREAWDGIVSTLREINRRAGLEHHSMALAPAYAVQMLRTGKSPVACVTAGQNVGVIYPTGEIAMCEFSKAFGKLQDYGMDFAKAWMSPEAEARRAGLKKCVCTHGCYLNRSIEFSRHGLMSMLRDL